MKGIKSFEGIQQVMEDISRVLDPHIKGIRELTKLDDRRIVDVFDSIFDIETSYTPENFNYDEFIKMVGRTVCMDDEQAVKNMDERINKIIDKTQSEELRDELCSILHDTAYLVDGFFAFYTGYYRMLGELVFSNVEEKKEFYFMDDLIETIEDCIEYNKVKREIDEKELTDLLSMIKVYREAGIFSTNTIKEYQMHRQHLAKILVSLYEKYASNKLILHIIISFVIGVKLLVHLDNRLIEKGKEPEYVMEIPEFDVSERRWKTLTELFISMLLVWYHTDWYFHES